MQPLHSRVPGQQRIWIAVCALALLGTAPEAFGQAAKKSPAPAAKPASSTLDRIRTTGSLKLGFRIDAQPFSYRDEEGKTTGYSVELCQSVAEAVKSELKLPGLKVEWVPVTVDEQLRAVQQNEIDVMCAAQTVTLERRKQVSFSAPIFPGGVGVVIRSDAPLRLKNTLSGPGTAYRGNWRLAALQVLQTQTFAMVAGTTADQWVKERRNTLQVDFRVSPVPSYAAGIQAVVDRQVNALFGERAILLDAVRRHPSSRSLTVLDRQFTFEPLALAIRRGDEDFRLLVDRSLSHFYASPGFGNMYTQWFGEPDEATITFFRFNSLPD
jgi:ABC-type amino acid transport substrate-binding protein